MKVNISFVDIMNHLNICKNVHEFWWLTQYNLSGYEFFFSYPLLFSQYLNYCTQQFVNSLIFLLAKYIINIGRVGIFIWDN